LAAAGVVEPVLIMGETGTGKELFARAVHEASPRANQPFLAVNCAAIPETLLESELFGYARGAFTGAVGERTGAMETANRGVLFLDEIGDMHPQSQGKVLRAIQEIVRLGSQQPRPVDVRVIAATNRDLRSLIHEGTFREDLYHRLNVLPISLPPLRERSGDVLDLAYVFLKRTRDRLSCQAEGFSDELLRRMNAYGWPGNVRELENRIKRAAILHPECRILDVQHFGELAAGIRLAGSRGRLNFLQRHANWRSYSKEDFASMLAECNNVRAEVARRLGLKSPKAITSKAQKLGMPKGQAGRAKANSESD
jgi:transcriptional regulator with GAF, ATPase, and Fis domain